jgi:iron complex outermembrane receptor protein
VPTCVDANQNFTEKRYDVELQDTYVFSDKLRVVNGAGFRRNIGKSETYLGTTVSNNHWRAFTNIEYKPTKRYSFNAGGFFERDQLTGSGFSPRIALNTHLTANQTARFIVSQAKRNPDIQEQRANWSYRVRNMSPSLRGQTEGFFFQSAVSPGNLEAEKNLSKEIGYLVNFPEYGLLLDAKVFHNKLTELISEKSSLSTFNPTNNNSATLKGAEFQVSYDPSDRWSMHLAYSYLLNKASTSEELTQYARHSGSLGLSYLFENQWRAAFAVYQYGATTLSQESFGREDLTFSKIYRLRNGVTLTPSFTASHLDNLYSGFRVDVRQQRLVSYSKAMQYFATMKVTF